MNVGSDPINWFLLRMVSEIRMIENIGIHTVGPYMTEDFLEFSSQKG
jgi:hypothetical protein